MRNNPQKMYETVKGILSEYPRPFKYYKTINGTDITTVFINWLISNCKLIFVTFKGYDNNGIRLPDYDQHFDATDTYQEKIEYWLDMILVAKDAMKFGGKNRWWIYDRKGWYIIYCYGRDSDFKADLFWYFQKKG